MTCLGPTDERKDGRSNHPRNSPGLYAQPLPDRPARKPCRARHAGAHRRHRSLRSERRQDGGVCARSWRCVEAGCQDPQIRHLRPPPDCGWRGRRLLCDAWRTEIMVQAGIAGVHITSPQVTGSKIARLIALNSKRAARPERGRRSSGQPRGARPAAQQEGRRLCVLVDFSAGHGRTGCADADAVLVLARAAPPRTPLNCEASNPIRAICSTSRRA